MKPLMATGSTDTVVRAYGLQVGNIRVTIRVGIAIGIEADDVQLSFIASRRIPKHNSHFIARHTLSPYLVTGITGDLIIATRVQVVGRINQLDRRGTSFPPHLPHRVVLRHTDLRFAAVISVNTHFPDTRIRPRSWDVVDRWAAVPVVHRHGSFRYVHRRMEEVELHR